MVKILEILMMAIKQLEKKIERIKTQLMNLGEMHPGNLSKQWNVCGKASCRCKDPDNPKKHGPYYKLGFTHKGKVQSRFIRHQFVEEIQKQIQNYKLFKKLMDEWKSTAMEVTKIRMEEQKENK